MSSPLPTLPFVWMYVVCACVRACVRACACMFLFVIILHCITPNYYSFTCLWCTVRTNPGTAKKKKTQTEVWYFNVRVGGEALRSISSIQTHTGETDSHLHWADIPREWWTPTAQGAPASAKSQLQMSARPAQRLGTASSVQGVAKTHAHTNVCSFHFCPFTNFFTSTRSKIHTHTNDNVCSFHFCHYIFVFYLHKE